MNYQHCNEDACRKGGGQHLKKHLNYRCPFLQRGNSKILNYFYSQEVTKSKVEFVSENMTSSLSPKCGPLVKSINKALLFITPEDPWENLKIGSLNPRRAHYYQTGKALIHSTNTAFNDQPLCVRY